jgi:hypothetical protein
MVGTHKVCGDTDTLGVANAHWFLDGIHGDTVITWFREGKWIFQPTKKPAIP